MSQQKFEEDRVSTGKFYMFRCLIVMAHADGVFSDIERGYMYSFMNHQRVLLSDEQYKTLEDDMDNPKAIEDLLPYINEPQYRSQLLYFARLMAFKDGVKTPDEDALLQKLHASTTDGIDLDTIRAEAKDAAQREINESDIYIDSIRPQGGWFGALDKLMLAMGVDLMRD